MALCNFPVPGGAVVLKQRDGKTPPPSEPITPAQKTRRSRGPVPVMPADEELCGRRRRPSRRTVNGRPRLPLRAREGSASPACEGYAQ